MNRAKELLQSVKTSRMEIRRCEYRIRQLEDQARSITAQASGMPSGSGDPHRDSTLIAIADMQTSLQLLKTEYAQSILKAERLIERIPNATYRLLLSLRYLDLMPWAAVQEELAECGEDFGMPWVYKLHGRALAEANLILEAEHEDSNGKK